MKNCTPSLPTSLFCCCPKTRQSALQLQQAWTTSVVTGFRFIAILILLSGISTMSLQAQSSDCVPGNVQNGNADDWSEECYLNDNCEEQGNPCQANDVNMIGAFIADINGGPVQTCTDGQVVQVYLWGRFNNNTNAMRYAVRSRTEVFVNGSYQTTANNCSFDVITTGTEDVLLLGPFQSNCGDLLQLLNTWVAWETSAAQCSDPLGDNFVIDCGDYPPSKCYKELAYIDFLTPNFSYTCGASTESTTEICFTNLSDGGEGALTYDWDFGDGGSSSAENPCHTYTTTNGIFYVTLTVTDENGIAAAAEASVNLGELDCCLLAIDCPDPDAGVYSCESDIPHPDNGNIIVLDSCGDVSVAISDVVTGTGCGEDTMYITRTYNITDGQNATTCQRVFRIIDDTAPLIVCPGDETYICASLVPPPNPNLMGTDDNCSGLVAVTVEPDVIINQDCANSYTIVRTYVATDVCGNQVEHAHNIFVNDLVAPLMSCPADLTVSCPSLVPPPSTSQVITSDNCGGTVEVELLPDVTTNMVCPNEFTITRTYIGTDACGNQVEHSQYITVADLALPTIQCPADVIVNCGDDVPAPDPSSVVVTDNCGGGVTVTVGADVTLNVACINGYVISRTYIATDACGNVATCEQLITVNDLIAPTLTCPANVTVSCASLVPEADISLIIAADNCDGDVTVTVNADVVTGLTCANSYLITRTYVATDACGNVATCAQLITVDDSTAPVIATCVANVSVTCVDDIPEVDLDAIVATDNCGGEIEISAAADVIVGLVCPNTFTVLRTYIATDACGNAATCQQTITVDDNEVPGITCLADVTVGCADEIPAADVSAIVTTDNCGGGVAVTVAADVITGLVCANNYTILRVYTATDACGNIATCTQTIVVDDNEAPEITCLADVEVSCASLVPAANIAAIVAVDNCPGAVTVTVAADVVTGLTCANNYTISRIYTATDVCGNTATCEQVITVNDGTAPAITCPANITVSCASLVPAANIALVTATDNCAGAVSVTVAADVITELDCANSYLIARVYTVTDVCGNTATCTQLITVNDIIPPVITTCVADVTVTCAAAIPAADIAAVEAADNCGGAVAISVAADVTTSFACPNEFTILRTYIATDICGNTATCVQTISVVDNTAPTISCLANVTVSCVDDVPEADVDAIITTDSCAGDVTVTVAADIVTGLLCLNTYTITRIYTATDGCGNAATCAQTITVDDNTPPTINCPANLTVSCASAVPAADVAAVVASDNCGGVTVTVAADVITSLDCPNNYLITRVYTATDACGNTATCTQTILVHDNTAPAITCPANVTVTCASAVPAADIASVLTSDNCDGVVTVTVADDVINGLSCANSYLITRVYTATDACGNSAICTQLISVDDSSAPVITCPENVTVSCASAVPEPDVASIITSDNCGGGVTVSVAPDVTVDLICANSFTIQRTYTAADVCGNTATCTQTITVDDNTPPVIANCIADVTVSCAAGIPAANVDAIVATDNCTGVVIVTVAADVTANFVCANEFNIVRTYIATDVCGNTATCAQTITVIDNIAPVITCPANVTVSCAGEIPTANVAAIVTSDNCAGAVTVTVAADVITGQLCANTYTITRIYTATDGCGNAATCAQIITVDDNTPPTITCPANLTVECASAVPAANVAAIVATDNCGAVTVTVAADVITSLGCPNNYLVTRVYTATDACGNIAVCTQLITVDDNTAPAITCPANVTVSCASAVPAANVAAVVTSDNCGGNATVTVAADVITGLTCPNSYTITRVYTATDACGNIATCAQTITVDDNTPPTVSCPANVTVSCASAIPAANVNALLTSDNCAGAVTVTVAADVTTSLVCANSFIIARTYTAVDVCGNVATCTQTITVDDNTPPVIATCIADVTVNCAAGIPAADLSAIIATDNCAGAVAITVAADVTTSLACPNEMTIVRTYIATDVCGNSATCAQTITVIDESAPSITCPTNLTVSCASAVPAANVAAIVTSDNCGAVTVTVAADVVTGLGCPNNYLVTRVYTATDACGNAATCTQTILVDDNTPPTITCPANLTVSCAGAVPAADVTAIVATDNCGGTVTVTVAADVIAGLGCPNNYLVTRVYTATDACGNIATCAQIITVDDNTPPTIACPANLTVSCASAIPVADIAGVVASDNCGPVTVTVQPDVTFSLGCPNNFHVKRVYVATDACGNTNSCTQVILVDDNTPPVVTCPANVTVSCASAVPAVDIAAIITSDNCTGGVTVTVAADVTTSLVCANSYIITRTYTAVDVCGNSATCSQTITVDDNTPPVITSCIADVTVTCAAGVPAANVGAIIATDNCAGAVAITVAADVTTSFACPNEYTLLRTYIATDVCGNTSTCAQTITVIDTVAPVIVCLADITVDCALDIPEASVDSVLVTDQCAGDVVVTVAEDVVIDSTCVNSYSLLRVYTATDVCGNTATCIQTITVTDTTAPVITCLADLTVECGSDVPLADISFVTAIDLCGGGVTVSLSADVVSDSTCLNDYVITRIYTATDACGNTATCEQTITVLDTVAPTLACLADITVGCAAEVPLADVSLVIGTDLCEGDVIVEVAADVVLDSLCANTYVISRVYTATDACGNAATCEQLIMVSDTIAPVIVCPVDISILCGEIVPEPDTASLTITDNCSGDIAITHVADDTTGIGCSLLILRTYSATDACGNIATCNQLITVVDTSGLPADSIIVLLPFHDTLILQCYGQDPNWQVPVYDENSIDVEGGCSPLHISFEQNIQPSESCEEDGYVAIYDLEWTVSDTCGNVVVSTLHIMIIDTIAPVIHNVPADITITSGVMPELPAVFATDECLCACIMLVETTSLDEGCANGQVITRTWTSTDDCGNRAVAVQHITVIDTTGPALALQLPDNISIPNGAVLTYRCEDGGIPAIFDGMDEHSMNVDEHSVPMRVSFEQTIDQPTNCEFAGYLEQRKLVWSAEDGCGNTSEYSFTIILIDGQAPEILHAPEFACVNDPILDLIEATDNCADASLRFWDVEVPNPCGNGMAIRRTYEALDNCGNMSRDTVTLIPDDNIAPEMAFIHPDLVVLEEGDSITISCQASNGNYTPYSLEDVVVTDSCVDGVRVEFDERVIRYGDCANDGYVALMELTWTATDHCGNFSTMSVMATVVDDVAPTFVDFLPEITIGCNDSLPNPEVADNCSHVTFSFEDTQVPGPCEYEYDVIRLIKIADACGNFSTATQIIHVGDGTGPDIEGVVEEVCDDLSIPVVTAYDPCSDQIVEVTMTQDTLDDVCADGMIIRRVWSATDACGHVATVEQLIYMGDTIAPEIMIPSWSVIRDFMDQDTIPVIMMTQTDIMEDLDELYAGSIIALDNCDEEIEPVYSVDVRYSAHPLVDGYNEQRYYLWVVSDACGNADSVFFTVNIINNLAAGELPNDTTVLCSPLPAPVVMSPDPSNGIVNVEYSETIVAGDVAGEFFVTRIWVATLINGTQTVTTQKIRWVPDTGLSCEIILPDTVNCNTHGLIVDAIVTGGVAPYTYLWEIEGDDCFIQGGQGTSQISIYMGWGPVVIRLIVTDAYGCETVCEVIVPCTEEANLGFGESELFGSNNNASTQTLTEAVEPINNIQLWPNPTDNHINLGFESQLKDKIEVTLINFIGDNVLNNTIPTLKGSNTHELDLSNLPDGLYILRIETQDKLYTRTITVISKE